MIGGATIAVVIAGESEKQNPILPPSHDPKTDKKIRKQIEREPEEKKPVLPWAEKIITERRKEEHRD